MIPINHIFQGRNEMALRRQFKWCITLEYKSTLRSLKSFLWVIQWCGRVIIVSVLSLRDKEILRERESLTAYIFSHFNAPGNWKVIYLFIESKRTQSIKEHLQYVIEREKDYNITVVELQLITIFPCCNLPPVLTSLRLAQPNLFSSFKW